MKDFGHAGRIGWRTWLRGYPAFGVISNKKGPCSVSGARAQGKFGGDLLSHGGNPAVPSALESLTAVFGMGTGVASPPSPPKAGYPRNHVRQPIRPACPKSFIR